MAIATALLASSSLNTWVAVCGMTLRCADEDGAYNWDVVVLAASGMVMGVSAVMLGLSLSRYREEKSLRSGAQAPANPRGSGSDGPLKRAIYNADTGSLDLIFGEPVALANQLGLLLVHGAGEHLENCSALDLGSAKIMTADGQPNDYILALAVSGDTRRRILKHIESDYARVALVICPGAIHSVASTMSDITEFNGNKPILVTDIDIRHEGS